MTATDDVAPEPELLDLRTWLVALSRLEALLVPPLDATRLARALRQAFHLSWLAPEPIGAVLGTAGDEETFERLLDAGALEEAARMLVPRALELRVLRAAPGYTVVLRANAFEAAGTWVASELAAALLGAWFSCAVAAGKTLIEESIALTQDPHRSRRAPHPSSNWH